jgi:hypothetical protein
MRFKQIIENSTTAGSVATVAQPMMTQARESVNVPGLKPVQAMKDKSKKKGPYANSIVEGKVNEDDLAEQDLIVIPGQGRLRRTGFVKHDLDQGEHEGHTLKNSLHTIARAASDLDKRLSVQSEFPEWVSEKIGAAKGMMVSVMDYLISSQEMQHDPEDMSEAYGPNNRRDAYQRDYDSSVSNMGDRQSDAYRQDGGGNDERHDLDPSDWYKVKDGKMFAASIYPRQVQQAIAQGFSRTKQEARAKSSSEGVAEGSGESYIIVRTNSEGKKDVFAGNFDTYERAQKELDGLLAHPLHTKYKQKFEIKRKGQQGVAEGLNEMDKTQTPPGRDGDIDWSKKQIHLGPEHVIKGKDVAQHALKALDKSMKKSHPNTLKKKGVAEGNDYFRRREREEGRIAGTIPAKKAVVKTNKPIGFKISDIGPGGKEHNVKTDAAWDAAKKKVSEGSMK